MLQPFGAHHIRVRADHIIGIRGMWENYTYCGQSDRIYRLTIGIDTYGNEGDN